MAQVLIATYGIVKMPYGAIGGGLSIILKLIERSDSLILGILGNLDHFRHLWILLNQSVVTRGRNKINLTN